MKAFTLFLAILLTIGLIQNSIIDIIIYIKDPEESSPFLFLAFAIATSVAWSYFYYL